MPHFVQLAAVSLACAGETGAPCWSEAGSECLLPDRAVVDVIVVGLLYLEDAFQRRLAARDALQVAEVLEPLDPGRDDDQQVSVGAWNGSESMHGTRRDDNQITLACGKDAPAREQFGRARHDVNSSDPAWWCGVAPAAPCRRAVRFAAGARRPFPAAGAQVQCRIMTQYTELTAAPAGGSGQRADVLRLAAAAYLARYKGGQERRGLATSG